MQCGSCWLKWRQLHDQTSDAVQMWVDRWNNFLAAVRVLGGLSPAGRAGA